MQRRRFYAPPGEITGSTILLPLDETHHLTRVLRLWPGDEVFVFDGCGREYKCRFTGIKSNRSRLEIIDALAERVESPLDLTLAQSLAKGEKFDLIVQKATELGIRRIIPLATERGDVRLADEKASKRLERWRRISLEALKQSGRRSLVEIVAPLALEDFLEAATKRDRAVNSRMLAFSERGGSPVSDAVAGVEKGSAVIVLVGPEGGWSEEELARLDELGAKAVTIGPRVLRTETAAIVAVALLQHALGDL
jgi:16S rRNA (uracil1498-N3)-methyltransferase